MSYFQFLIVFLLPPIALLGVYMKRSRLESKVIFLKAIGALCLLAFAYTTPWDNYLVATNVWSYGYDRVLGTIGYVPIEEYAFFFLQTIMSGLWCFLACSATGFARCELGNSYPKMLAVFFLAAQGLSLAALFAPSTRYLGLILSWSLPVIFLQLWFGLNSLLKNARTLTLCVAPPTIYLWFADAYAIRDNIWSISESQTTGVAPFGLPIEEAIFFLATNLMVAQGTLLFVGAGKEAARKIAKVLPFSVKLPEDK